MVMLVKIEEQRQRLCLEVAWEMDAIARVLPELVPNVDGDNGAHFVTRAMSGRLLRLSSVLMSMFDGDAETVAELAELAKVVTLDGGQG